MMLIRSVQPLSGFEVLLEFVNGARRVVDLDPLLHGPVFQAIRKDPEFFRAVQVDEELGTIVWPNGADMDPDVLYGTYVPAWMETELAIAA